MNVIEQEHKFTITVIGNSKLLYDLPGYHYKYFYSSDYARINRLIYNLFMENKEISITSLYIEIEKKEPDLSKKITELISDSPFWRDIRPIWDSIVDAWKKRTWYIKTHELIRQSGYTIKNGIPDFTNLSGDLNSGELITLNNNLLSELDCEAIEAKEVSMPDLYEEAFDYIKQQKIARMDGKFMHWGLSELDKNTLGIAKEYVYIGGKRSSGKTALFNHFVLVNAWEHEIGFISLESPYKHIMTRLISTITEIELQRLMKGWCDKDEINRVNGAREKISKLKLHIVGPETGRKSVDDIHYIAHRLKRKYGIKALGIDYIQLIKRQGKVSREEEFSEISKRLHSTSRELDIPFIVLSQMTDDHLKYAKALEEDADMIINIDRNKEDVKLIVGKSRDGWTGDCKVFFKGEYQKFYDEKPIPF